jgi:hypothetical protein
MKPYDKLVFPAELLLIVILSIGPNCPNKLSTSASEQYTERSPINNVLVSSIALLDLVIVGTNNNDLCMFIIRRSEKIPQR